MATKTTDWRPGPTVCRCCLSEGCYKDISTEYFWMGKREVYAEMLLDTLSLSIAYSQSGPNSNSRLICEPCISRLRDASDFRRQVQECEKTFMQYLDPGSSALRETEASVCQLETQVKVESVKEEKQGSDDEFVDRGDFAAADEEDDDDLDDQPLTKLASKIPKKEAVDLLDLLDNAKAGEKRKSTTKTKSTSAKKAKSKKEAKATSSKATKPEKKKKDLKLTSETSIWQLTVSERRNAAAFIHYTTIRPFIFMGFSFKCFFCLEYHSEVDALLQHTTKHSREDELVILEKYVPKGKRTLQVDISDLRCRMCEQRYHNLEAVRSHLENEHGVQFFAAGNGMTEYNMEAKNEVFTCHICSKEFHAFKFLNTHMNNHVNKVVCENCGAGFLNQHMLMKHKESHLIKCFNCQFCEKSYYKKSQLKYHTEIVHKGKDRVKPKKCTHCPQIFKEYYSKMAHLRDVHGVSKSFQCHVCKTNFATRRALTEHTNRYHTEKYKCDVCSKCFAIESRLKQHMRGHTGERSFVCAICKNAYMHQMTLRKHMRSHSNESKFICPVCGSGFHSKSDFEKHMKQWHHNFSENLENVT